MLISDVALMKAASGVPCREAHDGRKEDNLYNNYFSL